MARFCRILNGVVAEIYDGDELFEMHPNLAATWQEDESGLVQQGWEFDGVNFSEPTVPPATWEQVRAKQRSMIVKHQDLIEIHEREVAHDGTLEENYTITVAKYQEWLSYFQTIRANDEATHATPEEAITALDALTEPVTPGYNA